MRSFKYMLPLLGVMLLSACVTGIQDMQIDSIEMRIEDQDGKQVDELLPDTVYSIDFRVRDSSGELHLNPNYRDFRFSNLKHLELVQQARFSIKLRTDKSTFHAADTDLYGFSLAVKGNPYPQQSYSFPLNWDGFTKVDYSGIDGKDGEDGDSGASASGEAADEVEGGDGGDGSDGTRGYPGEDVTLVLSRYSYDGQQKLLLYAVEHQDLYLSEMKAMVVDASGGEGGDGGRGGNGGTGRTFDDDPDPVPGVAGDPGDGGDGADGGYGGDITLLAVEARLFNFIEPDAAGGEGGYGGAAGRAYADGDLAKVGREGRDGRDGRDGKVRYKTITPREMRELLQRIDAPGFELDTILY
ncbi:MAG: hypothetical protein ACOCZA_10570 [Spirochaetota bacterium]